ncbi:MAG: hypothetical protein WC897_01975 [Candidatus Gracilibacteria bacterium]
MIQKFDLKIGEVKTHEKSGKKYEISCDFFKDHDHKNKPIYHYHDDQKEDDIVATVEGNDCPPYDSPYSSEVKRKWIVYRENLIIRFTKKKTYLQIEIEEK